jgi:hypothetical protein
MGTSDTLTGRQLHLYVGPNQSNRPEKHNEQTENSTIAAPTHTVTPVIKTKPKNSNEQSAIVTAPSSITSAATKTEPAPTKTESAKPNNITVELTASKFGKLKQVVAGLSILFSSLKMKTIIRAPKTREGRDVIKLIFILVLFFLSLSGHVPQLITWLVHDFIYAYNSPYLDTASPE